MNELSHAEILNVIQWIIGIAFGVGLGVNGFLWQYISRSKKLLYTKIDQLWTKIEQIDKRINDMDTAKPDKDRECFLCDINFKDFVKQFNLRIDTFHNELKEYVPMKEYTYKHEILDNTLREFKQDMKEMKEKQEQIFIMVSSLASKQEIRK